MLIVITGGAASGKSEVAENISLRLGGKKLYVATMKPFGNEALERVERHKKLRLNKGFDTYEKFVSLFECDLTGYDTTLIECMSNLLANELFDDFGAGGNYFESITKGVLRMNSLFTNVVIVTNKIFSDGIKYDEATEKYMKALGKVNCFLASKSDIFIEVICSIPTILKGEPLYNEHFKRINY